VKKKKSWNEEFQDEILIFSQESHTQAILIDVSRVIVSHKTWVKENERTV